MKRFMLLFFMVAGALGNLAGCGGQDGRQEASPTNTQNKREPQAAFRPLEERVLAGWGGAIDGDRLVTAGENGLTVTDLAASHWQIVLYNLETGERQTITSGQGGHTEPDIDAGNVVWEDGRHVTDRVLRGGGNVPENNTDIYLYRIDTGKTIPIATESYKEGSPHVSGHRVVWEGYDGAYERRSFRP